MTVAALVATVGAAATTGDIEVAFLMVAAVVAGLACFDAAMDRSSGEVGPWLALSLAPVSKTMPAVLYELRASSGASFARYDHAGTLLFGLCVLAAVALIARPAPELGGRVAATDGAVIIATAAVAAVAGAAVAFLYERDFGSVAVARGLESGTWFVIGGLLAAVPIAAARSRAVTAGFAAFLLWASSVIGVLALAVIGAEIGPGWWAVVVVAPAMVSVWSRAGLPVRSDRNRPSNTAAVVAVLAGIVAAATAIAARSDRDTWGPGWALLGAASLVLFVVALLSRPAAEQLQPRVVATTDPGEQRPRARPDEPRPARAVGDGHEAATEVAGRLAPSALEVLTPPAATPFAADAEELTPPDATVTTEVAGRLAPSALEEFTPPVLSDESFVAAAAAAARVRNAPAARRHSLAPVEQAHHFDPSTGLLSAAGLQHAIVQAFGTPRNAGHVTMLLFAIRNLDDIEREHGRLAGAAVTRSVADRVRSALPDGSGARFRRTAYAILLVGDRSDARATVREMTQVLMNLREPVRNGSATLRIDVVAGMAQCYERERAASFVERANLALARAVQSPEPTLVAMP